MIVLTRFSLAIFAMALVVVCSNILVQFPVAGQIGAINLADLLTWGAFTYPFAFLVTDLTNRHFGPQGARRVVLVGFGLAVLMSIYLATPRIAIASGAAFLLAQLLDVVVFDRLRRSVWWHAPLLSSLIASLLDTLIFFSLAFAAPLVLLGPNDPFAIEAANPLGIFPGDVPRWISWALGDFTVKISVALVLLLPYRLLRGLITERSADSKPA